MFKISIFSKIYEACIGAARHKFASIFLAIFSFIESIFWPIPTDVVLAPMCLAKPNRALLYALNATVTSVLGAVVGYYIGYWLSTAFVKEFFESVNMIGTFNTVNEYLNEFGILFILIGFMILGFTLLIKIFEKNLFFLWKAIAFFVLGIAKKKKML